MVRRNKRGVNSVMRGAKKRADYCSDSNLSGIDIQKKRRSRKQLIEEATDDSGPNKSQFPHPVAKMMLSPIEFN